MNKKTEQFIKKALLKHNGLYNYDNVDYKSSYEHILIHCKKHGIFSQTPNAHLRGNGCSKCSRISNGKNKRLTFEKFKERILKINKNITFDKVDYTNTTKKIKLFCNKHNHSFIIKPQNAMNSKHVCPMCALDNTRIPKKSKDEFIEKLKKIYTNNEINFHNVVYNGYYHNAIVECTIHGKCEVSIPSLYKKNHCKECIKETQGFDCKKKFINNPKSIEEECFIYKRKIDNFYKIGIAKRGSKSRTGIPYENIEELFNIKNNRLNCWILEQTIIAYNKKMYGLYKPSKKFSGSNECFEKLETPIDNNISNIKLWKEIELRFNNIKNEIKKR